MQIKRTKLISNSILSREDKEVTIAISVKCTDGIVVASDSQSEYERGVDVKRLNANKIEDFVNCYLFAGAGVLSHIQILIENIKAALHNQYQQQRTILNKDETETVIEGTLLALVRHYNVDRGSILGIDQSDFFSPFVIFAGADIEQGFYLDLLHGSSGIVEPMYDYTAVGSGAAYAELLLRNFNLSDIETKEGIIIAAYVIDEVISIDPHCGGQIQIATITRRTDIDANTSREVPMKTTYYDSDAIAAYLEAVKPSLNHIRTELIPKVIIGEVDENKLREFTKNS